jgi:hypothetical protein
VFDGSVQITISSPQQNGMESNKTQHFQYPQKREVKFLPDTLSNLKWISHPLLSVFTVYVPFIIIRSYAIILLYLDTCNEP